MVCQHPPWLICYQLLSLRVQLMNTLCNMVKICLKKVFGKSHFNDLYICLIIIYTFKYLWNEITITSDAFFLTQFTYRCIIGKIVLFLLLMKLQLWFMHWMSKHVELLLWPETVIICFCSPIREALKFPGTSNIHLSSFYSNIIQSLNIY